MFINKPELSGALYPKWWDTGVIDKKCGRSGDPSTCMFCGVGCSGECGPGPHMICDLKGNWIDWNDLKNGVMVKLKTLHRHWPGYEYLYASVNGSILSLD